MKSSSSFAAVTAALALQLSGCATVVNEPTRPVRVDTLFDGRDDSPKLSDHDGFRVVYELSWPVERQDIAQRPPATVPTVLASTQ